MLLFGAFIAIFVGVGLVWKEIERRTLYTIFAKPVGRSEFLLGKYLGLCATLAVNVAVMGAGVTLVLLYVVRGTTPLVRGAVAGGGLDLPRAHHPHRGRRSCSRRSASPIVSAFGSLAVFVIGHFSLELKGFAAVIDSAPLRGALGGHLLPAAEPVDVQLHHAGGPRHRPSGRAPGRRPRLHARLGRSTALPGRARLCPP